MDVLKDPIKKNNKWTYKIDLQAFFHVRQSRYNIYRDTDIENLKGKKRTEGYAIIQNCCDFWNEGNLPRKSFSFRLRVYY